MSLYSLIKSGKVKVNRRSSNQHRFWSYIDKNGPRHPKLRSKCWLWNKTVVGGYGVLFVDGIPWKAHRYSYLLHRGEFPRELQVLHRCDNTTCTNPKHIFLGTQLDNIRDMQSKNRQRGAVGERNKKAKLSEEQVVEVRRKYKKGCPVNGCKPLADKLGVHPNSISNIVCGTTWGHLV